MARGFYDLPDTPVKARSEAVMPKRATKWIHYTKLKDNENQYKEKDLEPERVEQLARRILADGEVLEDLLVKKTDVDEYVIISGHTRREACRLLVEKYEKGAFALLPCRVLDGEEPKLLHALYSSNAYAEKTMYEKMKETEALHKLYIMYGSSVFSEYLGSELCGDSSELREKGREVEKIAAMQGRSKTSVGEDLKLARDLSDKATEAFKTGKITRKEALKFTKVGKAEQDECIEQGIVPGEEVNEIVPPGGTKDEEISFSEELVKSVLAEHKEQLLTLKKAAEEALTNVVRESIKRDIEVEELIIAALDLYAFDLRMKARMAG